MGARGRFGLVGALLLVLVGARPVLAERGAVTGEVSAGVGMFRVTPPGLGGVGYDQPLVAPAARLAVTHALSHTFELGLSFGAQTPAQRRIESATVRGRSGTFVESVTSGGLFGLLRLSGLGLIRRAFLELAPGLRYFHHFGRDHLRAPVPPETGFTSYDLGLSSITDWAPALALGLGWLWSGDRVGLGLRGRAEVALKGDHIAPSFGLQLFSSWSFYP